MTSHLYIALLHYPVYNKENRIVATSVTNLDIHDISRTVRTFGARCFYIVTPIPQQKKFVTDILNHWRRGYGAVYNPARKEAFKTVEVIESLEAVLEDIREKEGEKAMVVATGANLRGEWIRFEQLREKIAEEVRPCLVVFGTGWGIAEDIIRKADFLLEPIKGKTSYNHLPVRAAVAITLDRLAGSR
jgi:hypothetical protein